MSAINLFIAGTQKGGTTALAEFLAEHPQICVVQGKEAHVFDAPDIEQLNKADINSRYQQLLSHYQGEKICCDATPLYMYFKDIPARLADYNANAKVIVLLRDPAKRALSHYQMEKRRGDEPFGFAQALFAEHHRLSQSSDLRAKKSAWRLYSYGNRGYYSRQLANIYRSFSAEQVLVLRNSDLLAQHQHTLDTVCQFLAIDTFNSTPREVFTGRYNISLSERISLTLLRWCYWPEYRQLKKKYGIEFDE